MKITREKMKTIVIHMFRVKKQALAAELIDSVDHHLTRETCHFYSGGKLLFTLDQVVNAILDDTLEIPQYD